MNIVDQVRGKEKKQMRIKKKWINKYVVESRINTDKYLIYRYILTKFFRDILFWDNFNFWYFL